MRKYSIHDIDHMDGHEFEYFCADLLLKNGYDKAEVTPGSGDQGIDVIAYKDGIKFGVQCKCYTSDIGNKAVQEAYSGKEFYGCHIGAVLSNRFFTQAAKQLASRNRILLWDRDYLIGLLQAAEMYSEDNAEDDEADYAGEQTTERVIDINLSDLEKASAPESEPDTKYDVLLRIDDKMVIRNAGRREHTAQQIVMATGMTKAEDLSKINQSLSTLATRVSREQAEKIVRAFHSFGCTVYLEENHKTEQELQEEQRLRKATNEKNQRIAIPIMLANTLFFAFLTKMCWDKSTDGDLGILIVVFAIITILSILFLIAAVLGRNKTN